MQKNFNGAEDKKEAFRKDLKKQQESCGRWQLSLGLCHATLLQFILQFFMGTRISILGASHLTFPPAMVRDYDHIRKCRCACYCIHYVFKGTDSQGKRTIAAQHTIESDIKQLIWKNFVAYSSLEMQLRSQQQSFITSAVQERSWCVFL